MENLPDGKELETEISEITLKIGEKNFPWLYWFVVFGVIIGFYFYLFKSLVTKLPTLVGPGLEYWFFIGCFSALFYATLIVGGIFWYKKSKLERKRHFLLSKYLAKETRSLQDNLEFDFVTNLIKINFKYIDAYYLQTQIQADKAFLLTSYAAVIGLVVIVLGLLALFFEKTQPGYVATGIGLLGEFIAAVFFYLYNKTIAKMADYHQKLVLTQNLSLALKVAEDLPEIAKSEAKLKLVDYLSKDINQLITKANNA